MNENRRSWPGTFQRGGFDREGYYRVSDYELTVGWVGGYLSTAPPACRAPATPRAGFEAALLPALRRAPCVISFSGGRDSSALLAVATQVARREGLPDPIPATHDFRGQGRADETGFQESLVRHLGLRDWHRFTDPAAYDVLGPPARRGLLRHGLLWPAAIHAIEPMLALAAGGSLVTGEGGDEMLGPQRMTSLNHLVASRARPGRRAARMLARSLAPKEVRGRMSLRRLSGHGNAYDYLPRQISARVRADMLGDVTSAPLRWDHAVLRHTRSRATAARAANFRLVCAAAGVSFHEPFLDPAFAHPFAAAGGWWGWPDRTSAMHTLFGDVLPDEICSRTGKAEFGAVAIGPTSRDFLARWRGEGVDRNVIDVDALRAGAANASLPFGARLLVQAAWLATQRDARPPAERSRS